MEGDNEIENRAEEKINIQVSQNHIIPLTVLTTNMEPLDANSTTLNNSNDDYRSE